MLKKYNAPEVTVTTFHAETRFALALSLQETGASGMESNQIERTEYWDNFDEEE